MFVFTSLSTVSMISCINLNPNEFTGGRFRVTVVMPFSGSVSKMIEFSAFVEQKRRKCDTVPKLGRQKMYLKAILTST